jgi:outer membrane protein assembly factor BamE (lipoprotein component of BamABCDE complex)
MAPAAGKRGAEDHVVHQVIPPRTTALALAAAMTLLAGCSGTQMNPLPAAFSAPDFTIRQVQTRGFVLQEGALDQVPVGSSRDQVMFVLGSPTTIATLDNEVFYYISQQVELLPGMRPRVIDQRVVAVYFDGANRVSRVANYGLQDGRVIDFVSRATPSGGRETTFLQQIFSNLGR